MDRRSFIGGVLAFIGSGFSAALAATSQTLKPAHEGESLSELVVRSGFRVVMDEKHTRYVCRLTRPNGKVILNGPPWKGTPTNPDAPIPRGYRGIIWEHKVGKVWVYNSSLAFDDYRLSAGEKVRLRTVPYDPRK